MNINIYIYTYKYEILICIYIYIHREGALKTTGWKTGMAKCNEFMVYLLGFSACVLHNGDQVCTATNHQKIQVPNILS